MTPGHKNQCSFTKSEGHDIVLLFDVHIMLKNFYYLQVSTYFFVFLFLHMHTIMRTVKNPAIIRKLAVTDAMSTAGE